MKRGRVVIVLAVVAGTLPVLTTESCVVPSVTTKRTIAPDARTLPGTT